ncbi:MAG TPA: sulfate/molybdate ABC transporter ATP-binding protein [Caulobacteraceae bacterium]|nr:sulfate/molybdate ABC transporter ATP-binding protein [Caulobacteraceae bacterium]
MSCEPPVESEGAFSRALEIQGLSKAFGRYPALRDVSFTAQDREFLALLGPSGSGKTTLLRVLAGLEAPDAGEVRFGGEDYLAIPARRRRAGMVFQHYALFRHMTVAQNIAFGLKVRPRAERPSASEIKRRVGDLLALVQLEGLDKRYPAQLSGGQRQRVALARALAIEPRMLLLDEPFGALDAQVRRDLRRWLREMHDRVGVTTVFVTHDQEEALDLADRVAILREGRLIQLGAPQELYDQPASAFVYDFLGPSCRLPGVVEHGRLRVGDWITPASADAPVGEVDVYFRPDEVEFAPRDGAGLTAQVRATVARGPQIRLECLVEGRPMELQTRDAAPASLAAGQAVRFRPLRPRLYPRSTEPVRSP